MAKSIEKKLKVTHKDIVERLQLINMEEQWEHVLEKASKVSEQYRRASAESYALVRHKVLLGYD